MDPVTAATTAAPPTQPEPTPAPSPRLGGLPQLLDLVLRLIAHGKDFAATLHQRAAEPGFDRTARVFGSSDLGVIAACLRRGIMRATALYAMLSRRAASGLDAPCPRLPMPRAPHDRATAGPPPTPPAKWWTTAGLGYLPTQEEIDDEVRHRGFAPLLVDTCLDLAVYWETANDLWSDIGWLVTATGGSSTALLIEVNTRLGKVPEGLLNKGATSKRWRVQAGPQADAEAWLSDVLLPAQKLSECEKPVSEPRDAAGQAFRTTHFETEPTMHWPVKPIHVQEVAAAVPS